MHQLIIRNTAYQKFLKSESIYLLSLDKDCEESIKVVTELYLEQFCQSNGGLHGCFRLLKALKSNSLPQSFHLLGEDKLLTDCTITIANAFNEFLVKSFEKPAHVYGDFSEDLFNNVPITFSAVYSALLKTKDGCGLDRIPGLFHSSCASDICFHVLKHFLHITETSCFPSNWKKSYIRLVYKNGLRNFINSCRPISILSKWSFAFERILFDFLYEKVCNKIHRQQYGFLKNKSTVLQLLVFLDELYHSHDNDLTAYCCSLDFSRAFDEVPHSSLLDKLRKFGIGGALLKLFSSYLSDRYQCVKVGDVYSEYASVASSVLQDAILGPLLFVILIKDLSDVCNSSLFFLYADDNKMICRSMPSLQSRLKAFIEWSKINLVQFIAAKTQFLVIGIEPHSLLLFNEEEIISS